jgi:hypothetical protein
MTQEVQDRRRHPRVPVRLTATLARIGTLAHVEEVDTVDLSEGGAGIMASDRFQVGDVVVLTVGSEDVDIGYQGLVVGRHPADEETGRGRQLLNIAFKTMRDDTLRSLQRLLQTHGTGPAT